MKSKDQIFAIKVFWGQNLRKQLSNSESAYLNTSASFWTKFAKKRYLRDGNWKSNSQIQNQHPWKHTCIKFHAKQNTLKFLDQLFPPKKVFWRQNWEDNCSIQNQHSWIPPYTKFPFKQSTLKSFRTKFEQNKCSED